MRACSGLKSLKARAALLTEASQLPDHQDGDAMLWDIRKLVSIIFISFGVSSALASGARSLEFSISISGGSFPIVSAATNAADGTRLLVNLKKPWLADGPQRVAHGLRACGDDCFPATGPDGQIGGVMVNVKNGGFVAGPYSFLPDRAPFKPGKYILEISLSADPATASIETIRAIGTILYSSEIEVRAP
jgi:hypothetical protein